MRIPPAGLTPDFDFASLCGRPGRRRPWAPVPPPAPAPAAPDPPPAAPEPVAAARLSEPPAVDPAHHIGWVRTIARAVARRHGVRGEQEIADVQSAGFLQLLEISPRFRRPEWVASDSDLTDAYRGWANLWVKKTCERECERLRNGGTYWCRRQTKGQALVVAVPFSSLVTPKDGDEVEPASGRDMDARPCYQRFLAEALS